MAYPEPAQGDYSDFAQWQRISALLRSADADSRSFNRLRDYQLRGLYVAVEKLSADAAVLSKMLGELQAKFKDGAAQRDNSRAVLDSLNSLAQGWGQDITALRKCVGLLHGVELKALLAQHVFNERYQRQYREGRLAAAMYAKERRWDGLKNFLGKLFCKTK